VQLQAYIIILRDEACGGKELGAIHERSIQPGVQFVSTALGTKSLALALIEITNEAHNSTAARMTEF
jgi:hypothetical protein